MKRLKAKNYNLKEWIEELKSKSTRKNEEILQTHFFEGGKVI